MPVRYFCEFLYSSSQRWILKPGAERSGSGTFRPVPPTEMRNATSCIDRAYPGMLYYVVIDMEQCFILLGVKGLGMAVRPVPCTTVQ